MEEWLQGKGQVEREGRNKSRNGWRQEDVNDGGITPKVVEMSERCVGHGGWKELKMRTRKTVFVLSGGTNTVQNCGTLRRHMRETCVRGSSTTLIVVTLGHYISGRATAGN